MTLTVSNALYSDINSLIGVIGNTVLMLNEDAVLNSVINIISTRKGERIFDPEFGSKIPDLLFEPIDAQTAHDIKISMILAIEKWEPRVKIHSGRTSVIPIPLEQYYQVTLAMFIVGIGFDNDYTLFFRRRGNIA